jgi:hypothetical protein
MTTLLAIRDALSALDVRATRSGCLPRAAAAASAGPDRDCRTEADRCPRMPSWVGTAFTARST